MSISSLFPNIRPSLNLDFTNSKTIDPRITFSRASTGTFFDGKTVAKAEENLFLNSAGPLLGYVGGASVDSATGVATFTSAANNGHKTRNAATSVGEVFTVSVDLSGTGVVRFSLLNGSGSTLGGVQTVTLTSTPTRYFATGTNNSAGNNCGFSVAGALDNSTATLKVENMQFELRAFATAYTPTTGQPITRYQPVLLTAPANTPRIDHDPVTGECKGLLVEESRTNLLTYSEQFNNAVWLKSFASVQDNVVVAPDGTITADKMIESVGFSTHFVSISTTLSAGGTYTLSVYVKAAGKNTISLQFVNGAAGTNCFFDLASGTNTTNTTFGGYGGSMGTPIITHVGNGWYRCSTTVTIDSTAAQVIRIGTTTGNGDGYSGIYIWGAHLETGAFPTSYIKTEASQVTRAVDNASMTGTNFSSWYRQDEGTLVADTEYYGNSGSFSYQIVLGSIPGIVSDVIFFGSAGGRKYAGIRKNSTAEFNVDIAGSSVKERFKQALAFKENGSGYSEKGSAVILDSQVQLPIVDKLYITAAFQPISSAGLTIKRLTYYPKRLSNQQLQALTL